MAIVGARRPSHLEGTAAAAALALSPEDLGGIDAVLADAVPVRVRTPKGCDEASRT